MTSECPKCGCREFKFKELPSGNDGLYCTFCGFVLSIINDNSASDAEDILTKYKKVLDLESPTGDSGDFEIVSLE